jgi:hypothetical protein
MEYKKIFLKHHYHHAPTTTTTIITATTTKGVIPRTASQGKTVLLKTLSHLLLYRLKLNVPLSHTPNDRLLREKLPLANPTSFFSSLSCAAPGNYSRKLARDKKAAKSAFPSYRLC